LKLLARIPLRRVRTCLDPFQAFSEFELVLLLEIELADDLNWELGDDTAAHLGKFLEWASKISPPRTDSEEIPPSSTQVNPPPTVSRCHCLKIAYSAGCKRTLSHLLEKQAVQQFVPKETHWTQARKVGWITL